MIVPSRQQRRQLARDSRDWPVALQAMARESWPIDIFDPARIAVWRSRDWLVQQFTAKSPAVARLSINSVVFAGKRWIDGISWEQLQLIKDEVGFGDYDAVEVFPASGDVVNVANMRHLWILRDKLPFAWRVA